MSDVDADTGLPICEGCGSAHDPGTCWCGAQIDPESPVGCGMPLCMAVPMGYECGRLEDR